MKQEVVDKYSAELVSFADTLLMQMRQEFAEISLSEKVETETIYPPKGQELNAKAIILVGILLSVCGFLWTGNIVGCIGLVIIIAGYYFAKQKPHHDNQQIKKVNNNASNVASSLYVAVEKSHKQCSVKWIDFIEKQRLKINEEIKSSDLDEQTKRKLLDSQIANTVLKYPLMEELNTLNSFERSGCAFDTYVSDFLSRYKTMLYSKVSEQQIIYNKLSE